MTAWLLPTLSLTSLTLGSSLLSSGRPISAWDRPPVVGLPAFLQRRCRAVEPQRCSSSAAASSDSAREEESWPAELNVEPLFRPYPNQQQRTATWDRARTFAKPLPTGTILRGMQDGDVDGVVSLAFTEYYEGPTEFSAGVTEGLGVLKSMWERALENGKFQEEDVEKLTDWLEMIWLRIMIRWGFGMRVSIGQRGEDHRVFCVAGEEREDGDGHDLPLAAVAEISLQVPNGRTATPFPLPLWVKRLMAWPGPVLPYISNVLVHPHARRQGYANRLMLRCEEQAREWGYCQVYLHVDLTYYPAVRMYETMGYEVVNDLEVSFETPRLRYMKKIL